MIPTPVTATSPDACCKTPCDDDAMRRLCRPFAASGNLHRRRSTSTPLILSGLRVAARPACPRWRHGEGLALANPLKYPIHGKAPIVSFGATSADTTKVPRLYPAASGRAASATVRPTGSAGQAAGIQVLKPLTSTVMLASIMGLDNGERIIEEVLG